MPREGHDYTSTDYSETSYQISIHVPREGHDDNFPRANILPREISIHVPREGHDFKRKASPSATMRFQSTCPARGTT